MNNIEDIIREVQEQEIVEIEGNLSEESRKRIEGLVLEEILAGQSNKKQYRRRKRWLVLGVAAVLTLGMGLSVAAKEQEWDITLLNFMGISDANTLQLETGEVQIDQGQTSLCVDFGRNPGGEEREVEIKAVTSIGDRNEVYIRIETDYEVPKNFDPQTDYIQVEDFKLDISENHSGYGAEFVSFVENNKLGFLLSISDCKKINTARISLKLENLIWYHDLNHESDAKEELICEGTWELNWKFCYKGNAETYRFFKPIQNNGVTYYLTKVEVSPISVRMEAYRNPADRKEREPNYEWLEEIYLEDGRVLVPDEYSGAGNHNGLQFHSYVGVEEIGEALEPLKVKKIVICGEEIELQ